MLKHHEIHEITEKRVGREIEEGKWFEIWNIWDYIVARDEYYALNGVVTLIGSEERYKYPNCAFDTYEEALQFIYCYEQTAGHAADVKELEALQERSNERQRQSQCWCGEDLLY